MLPDELAELADRVRRHFNDACFACGRENPIGLHLDDFSLEDDAVEAWFRPRAEYRGVPGSVHGGVVSTALDEVMAWTCILIERVMAVTATLDLRFRSPVRPDMPYRLRGRVEDRTGKRIQVSGGLFDGDSAAVLARGVYVATAGVDSLIAGNE